MCIVASCAVDALGARSGLIDLRSLAAILLLAPALSDSEPQACVVAAAVFCAAPTELDVVEEARLSVRAAGETAAAAPRKGVDTVATQLMVGA